MSTIQTVLDTVNHSTFAHRFSSMHSDPIRFIVGKDEDEKTFLIPRDILSRSGVFPKDMNLSTSSDGEPITINLPDESPSAFTSFYSYIFFHDVKFPPLKESDPEVPEIQQQREKYVHELCQTWVLGDKYSIPGLQNCAIFRLCRLLRSAYTEGGNCISLETMKYCYENTEPGAKLRTLVADQIIRIENRGYDTGIDLLAALSAYIGFTRDVIHAQQSWDSGGSKSPTYDLRMKFLEPYRYASRYEVDVENRDEIPATSRAVWRPSLLTFRCHYCGVDGDMEVRMNGALKLCDSCSEVYYHMS